MWHRFASGLGAFLLIGLISVSMQGTAWTAMPNAAYGRAPSIELLGLDGRPHNTDEFIGHGKWVIVMFWSHDCDISDREIHEMIGFHANHRDIDAIVLGVSIDGIDNIASARAFAVKQALPFTNLITDPEEELMKRFGGGRFFGTPTYYFYDPIGRIVARKIGPIDKEDIEAFIEVFNASPYARQ